MERARATWTDERLDDLSRSVDRVDADFRQLRTEMNGRFDALERRLGSRIDAVDARLGARIDGVQRMVIQLGGATIATVRATLATVIART
jgi:tetrahydromethanopterin S-methyltransferase subunit G